MKHRIESFSVDRRFILGRIDSYQDAVGRYRYSHLTIDEKTQPAEHLLLDNVSRGSDFYHVPDTGCQRFVIGHT